MNCPKAAAAGRYQQGQVVAAHPDATRVDLGPAEQELCAAQAIRNYGFIDELVRILDAVRQQARVGGGVWLVGEALTTVRNREDDVATSVVPVRNVVDAPIAWYLEEGGERPQPLRHAE